MELSKSQFLPLFPCLVVNFAPAILQQARNKPKPRRWQAWLGMCVGRERSILREHILTGMPVICWALLSPHCYNNLDENFCVSSVHRAAIPSSAILYFPSASHYSKFYYIVTHFPRPMTAEFVERQKGVTWTSGSTSERLFPFGSQWHWQGTREDTEKWLFFFCTGQAFDSWLIFVRSYCYYCGFHYSGLGT